MGSSEIVDSGKGAGKGTNFSHTCGLLSQYLKEKGSFGELSLGLSPNLEHKVAPTGTMNLLQKIDKSGQNSLLPEHSENPSRESAPLTIFYAGQVIVYNDFPAEKASEIMRLASRSTGGAAGQSQHFAASAPPPPNILQSPAESATFPKIVPNFGVQERPYGIPQPHLASDLPIARKNSLARFLEKRRDRVKANEPYQARAALKTVKNEESWLGLATQRH